MKKMLWACGVLIALLLVAFLGLSIIVKSYLKMDAQTSGSRRALPAGSFTGQFMRYVKDEKGWTVVPLRITGTTEKPSVGLNQAGVGKHLQKGATEEIEKQLCKGIFGR